MKEIAVIDAGSWSLTYDFFFLRELAKQVPVRFYCSDTDFNGEFLDAIEGIQNVTIVKRRLSGRRLTGIIEYLVMMVELLWNRRRFLAIHFVWSPVPVVDVLFFLFLKKKLVLTIHNHRPHKRNSRRYLPFYLQYRLAKATVFVSQFTRDAFFKDWRHDGKDYIFPIGASPITPSDDVASTKSPQFVRELKFWGNVKRYKGLSLLLDHYATIRSLGWSLKIYGKFDRDCSDELNKARLLDIHVTARFLNNSEVLDVLTSGGVLVFPYKGISQSGAMYTAVYYCVPFICTRKGDMYEFLMEYGLEALSFGGDCPDSISKSLKGCLDFVENNYQWIVGRLREIRSHRNWQLSQSDVSDVYF